MRVFFFDLAKITRNVTVLTILAASVLLFYLMVGQTVPTAGIQGKVINKVITEEKALALTFNVRDKAKIAPAVRTLEEEQGKATFFVDPRWAQENKNALRHLSLQGHGIGILVDLKDIDSPHLAGYMAEAKKLFTGITGESPSLARCINSEGTTIPANTVYSLGYLVIGDGTEVYVPKKKKWLFPGSILSIPLEGNNSQIQDSVSSVIRTSTGKQYRQVTVAKLLSLGPGTAE